MNEAPLKTKEEVLEDFARKGVSLRSWAITHNLSPAVVAGVLKGRIAGRIGEGHKAAVLLGLKDGEIVEK
ncbi:MAG: hypothetical protein JWR60_3343 [Polaromonas sp.]|nr:hypothetical protein [Polaromonas sp.]